MRTNRSAIMLAGCVVTFLAVRAYSVHAQRTENSSADHLDTSAAVTQHPWLAANALLGPSVSTADEAPTTPDEPAHVETPDFRRFKPSEHGFRFTNAFSGSPMPPGLDALGSLFGAPTQFGLCGGMSSAAADMFLAGQSPPSESSPPKRGAALYNTLWKRQIESFGGAFEMVLSFASWMNKSDDGPFGTRHLSTFTIAPIEAALAKGQPAVVALVLTSNKKNEPLWENHQVLGLSSRREGKTTFIRIYDPNHPLNDNVEIECVPVVVGALSLPGPLGIRVPILGLRCTMHAQPTPQRPRKTDMPIRGIFMMPYDAPKADAAR